MSVKIYDHLESIYCGGHGGGPMPRDCRRSAYWPRDAAKCSQPFSLCCRATVQNRCHRCKWNGFMLEPTVMYALWPVIQSVCVCQRAGTIYWRLHGWCLMINNKLSRVDFIHKIWIYWWNYNLFFSLIIITNQNTSETCQTFWEMVWYTRQPQNIPKLRQPNSHRVTGAKYYWILFIVFD